MEQKINRSELERELKKKVSSDDLQKSLEEVDMTVNNKQKDLISQLDQRYVDHQEYSKQLSNKLTLNEVKGLLDNKVSLNQF